MCGYVWVREQVGESPGKSTCRTGFGSNCDRAWKGKEKEGGAVPGYDAGVRVI